MAARGPVLIKRRQLKRAWRGVQQSDAAAAALVGLVLMPLALLWLWPLPSDLTHLVPSEPDTYLANFHQIWLAWLLGAEDPGTLLSLKTTLVQAPDGVDLRYYQEWLTAGLTALLAAPLSWLGRAESLVAGQTLGYAVAWSGSGAAAWLLGRRLGGPGAAVALMVAALSAPFLRGAVAMACPEFLWFGTTLLAILAVLKAAPGGAVRAGVVAAGFGALAGLGTRYLSVATTGWLVALLVGALVARRRPQAAAAGTALALMVPILLFLGWPQLNAGPDPEVDPNVFMTLPVYPAPGSFFWPEVVYNPEINPAWETHTYTVYVGWVLLALGSAGAARGDWRHRSLFAGGACFLIAALGWATPNGATLPLGLLHKVLPVVENLHAPSRFVHMAQLGLAAAATGMLRNPAAAAAAAAAILVEFAVAASTLFPLPSTRFPDRDPLIAQRVTGRVLELSAADSFRESYHHDIWMEARQVHHGGALVNLPAWPGGGAYDSLRRMEQAGLYPWLEAAFTDQTIDSVFSVAVSPDAPINMASPDWVLVDDPVRDALYVCELRRAGQGMLVCRTTARAYTP